MAEKFTKSDFAYLAQEVIYFYVSHLRKKTRVESDWERRQIILFNSDKNYNSFLSIVDLFKEERVADIYTLNRAMFESVINMAVLTTRKIPDDVNRYKDFPFLELYKIYKHMKEIGLEHLSGITEEESESLEKLKSKYFGKWGNSLSWSGKNLLEMTKLVDLFYPKTWGISTFYEYLYCQVYRKGSQATHSNYIGVTRGKKIIHSAYEDREATKIINDDEHLLFASFHGLFVFLSSIRFFGYEFNLPHFEDYFQDMTTYLISND